MPVTDQQILSDVQSLVSEPLDGGVTWPSGMWTQAEVLHYLDDAQQETVTQTACVLKRLIIPCVPHVLRQELPEDFLELQRVVWVRNSDLRHYGLHRADIWELDAAAASNIGNWRTEPGIPTFYTTGDVPTRTVQVAPAAAVPGALHLTYLAVPTLFTGAGVAAEVPDEVTVGLVWQTIQHMLLKEGRARDVGRAGIAGERATMVREALKLLLQGWEA